MLVCFAVAYLCYVCMCMCILGMHVCIYVCVMFLCMHVWMDGCANVCLFVSVCVCLCVYVCVRCECLFLFLCVHECVGVFSFTEFLPLEYVCVCPICPILTFPRGRYWTRSEWLVNQHRDSNASYVGHVPMMAFFAVAENESMGRIRHKLLHKMIQPCGPAPRAPSQ